MTPIVASFFTRDGRYPALAHRLHESCARLGIDAVISEMTSKSWLENNNRKPGFILDVLLARRGPVWWLDCDCYLLPRAWMGLTLVPQAGYDFGIYNWHADADNVNNIAQIPGRLLGSGGVIYFNYTAPAIELLLRWQDEIRQTPCRVDDQSLDVVFNSLAGRPPVTPFWFGKSMNWMTGLFGPPPDNAYICHEFVNRAHFKETDDSDHAAAQRIAASRN